MEAIPGLPNCQDGRTGYAARLRHRVDAGGMPLCRVFGRGGSAAVLSTIVALKIKVMSSTALRNKQLRSCEWLAQLFDGGNAR
jgi:hypothetical protein